MYLLPQNYEISERISLIKKHLDQGMSFYDIAQLFGVTEGAIKYHWERYGNSKDFSSSNKTPVPAQAKLERNQEIFWERLNEGTTFSELGRKHNLSSQRIGGIVFSEGRALKRKIRQAERSDEIVREVARRAALDHLKIVAALKKAYNIERVVLDETLKTPIENLELTTRAYHSLKNKKIQFLEELEYMSEADLLIIPNLGRKSLKEIKEIAKNFGYIIGSKKQ